MLDVFDAENRLARAFLADCLIDVEDAGDRAVADSMYPDIHAPLCRAARQVEHLLRSSHGDPARTGGIEKRLGHLGGMRTERAIRKNFDCLKSEVRVAQAPHDPQPEREV